MSALAARYRHLFSLGAITALLAACGSGTEEPQKQSSAGSAGYHETAAQQVPQEEQLTVPENSPEELAAAQMADAIAANRTFDSRTKAAGGYVRIQYGSPTRPELWNLSQSVWIRDRGEKMRYQMQWLWNEWRRGILQIEADVQGPSGSIGDQAYFGVNGANGARGPNCIMVGGDPSIRECTIPTTITDRSYHRLFVWRLEADDQGQWWGAWVVNRGRAHWIGSIRLSAAGEFIRSTPDVYAEYQGPRADCSKIPRSSAFFFNTVGNRYSANYSQVRFRASDITTPDCPTERAFSFGDPEIVLVRLGDLAAP